MLHLIMGTAVKGGNNMRQSLLYFSQLHLSFYFFIFLFCTNILVSLSHILVILSIVLLTNQLQCVGIRIPTWNRCDKYKG